MLMIDADRKFNIMAVTVTILITEQVSGHIVFLFKLKIDQLTKKVTRLKLSHYFFANSLYKDCVLVQYKSTVNILEYSKN